MEEHKEDNSEKEEKHESREEHKGESKETVHTHHIAQENVSHTKHELTERMRKNPWMLSSIVLGIITLVLLFNGGGVSVTGDVISSDSAGQKLLTYYEANGAQGLVLDSVEEENGLYKVNFDYQGSIIPIYMTKDGSLAGSLTPLTGSVIAPTGGSDTVGSGGSVVDVSIDDDAVKGDANAPVTIIEFSDYECPFCGRFYSDTLPQIISEYIDTGKVKLVYRDFPLNFHPQARKAAEAAECAGEQGKYYEMHDLLFEKGVSGGESSFKQYAKDIGLDSSEFDSCLDSGEMADEVQKDLDDGTAAGVSGTPGFFINGRQLSGAQPFSAFKTIIDEELAAAN